MELSKKQKQRLIKYTLSNKSRVNFLKGILCALEILASEADTKTESLQNMNDYIISNEFQNIIWNYTSYDEYLSENSVKS